MAEWPQPRWDTRRLDGGYVPEDEPQGFSRLRKTERSLVSFGKR